MTSLEFKKEREFVEEGNGLTRAYSRWIASAFLILQAVSFPVFAIRFDWTAQELACASSLGIDLRNPTTSSSPAFLKHLTWIADAVAVGRITEIRHDIDGPYHTIATIAVEVTEKGNQLPPTIDVCLVSGPSYFPRRGLIGETYVSTETMLAVGDHLLLFLTRDFMVTPEDPLRYALGENQYRLVDGYRLTVNATSVQKNDPPTWSAALPTAFSHIRSTVAAQAAGCH